MSNIPVRPNVGYMSGYQSSVPKQRSTFGKILRGISGFAGAINPLLGAGVGLFDSIMNRRTSVRNMNQQNLMRRQMAEYQYSKDLEMWNRMNEYNSPAMQMERFKEAGLNPKLIYGKGDAGSASIMPKYNAPQLERNVQPFRLGPTIQGYQDTMMRNAQIDNVKAQTERTKVQTVHEGIKQALTAQSTQETKERIELIGQQVKGLEYDNEFKEWRKSLNEQGLNTTDSALWRFIYTGLLEADIDPKKASAQVVRWFMDNVIGIDDIISDMEKERIRSKYGITMESFIEADNFKASDQGILNAIAEFLIEFGNMTLHHRWE